VVASSLVLAAMAEPPADYVSEVWHTKLAQSNRDAELRGTWLSTGDMSVYVSHPGPLGHARPPAGYPVVLVAHHAVGVYHATFLREYCDALAAEGYLAVLPDLFHRVWSDQVPTGLGIAIDKMDIKAMLGSQRDADIVADLEATLGLLAANRSLYADTQRVGVLGFCMGGRIAWLAAVNAGLSRAVRAAVAYHGGNVWKAYPEAPGAEGPGQQLAALACPVLGLFGGLDANPSPEDMAKLQESAGAAGKQVEFHVYPGAKHGFSCRDSANYMAEAAEASWARTVEFLSRTLARAPLPDQQEL